MAPHPPLMIIQGVGLKTPQEFEVFLQSACCSFDHDKDPQFDTYPSTA